MSKRRLAYELYTFKEIAKFLPVQRTHHTLYRWATKGARTSSGRIIKLKTYKVNGVMHTNLDLFEDFLRGMQR